MGDADGLIYTCTVDSDAPFYHKSELWNGQTGAYVLKLLQTSLSDDTQSPTILTPFSTWSLQADEIVLGTVFGDLYFWDLDGLSPS